MHIRSQREAVQVHYLQTQSLDVCLLTITGEGYPLFLLL